MKKTILFLLGICLMTKLFAQVPPGIPYQSAMRNSSGGILANQSVFIRFSIHDSAITGAIVYQETHNATTSAQGIVSLTIGQGTALTGTFAGISWGQHAKFLQVEMNVTGGTSYVDMGTQQMMSVPYALYAETSGGTGFIHWIGESYGGGVVIDVWKDSSSAEHGTIMALNNVGDGNGNNWGPSILTYDEYYGANNCNLALQNSPSPNSAIALCHNYNAGGYTDWYLPARFEMMNADLLPVRRTLTLIGGEILNSTNTFNGLQAITYWTSTTQYASASSAYTCFVRPIIYPSIYGGTYTSFMNGSPLECDERFAKSGQCCPQPLVRPVRRF